MAVADHTSKPVSRLLDLSGRRAVVTGAGRGIGEAIARRLAESGARVLVTDLDEAAAAGVAHDLNRAFGGDHLSARLDISDTPNLVSLVARALEDLGGLDTWVNNAGIYPATGPAIDATDEFIDRMLLVNVRGTFAAAREAARSMERGSVIVNLASTAGFRASTGISVYSTSKHAVVGLTKSLAVELASKDIRVVGVAPTAIDTPGVREQLEPLRRSGLDVEATMAANLLGRTGVPDDVARVVLFAVSDMAAFVTGSTILADAGSLAGR